MKYCKDCEYFGKEYRECRHPKGRVVDLIENKDSYSSAFLMRLYEHKCGDTGELFLEKVTPTKKISMVWSFLKNKFQKKGQV